MSFLRSVFALISCLVLFAACAKKPPSGGTSKIVFQLPASMKSQSQVGAFGSSACFAVNISASDINAVSGGACEGTSYGLFGGLVPVGNSIELEAQYGSARTIEIYYVISENGCHSFDPSLGLGQTYGANKVHRIAQVTGIDFNQAEVVVEMPIDWPAANNTLKSLHGLPASCDRGDTPVNLMALKQARVVQGSYRETNANHSVQIRILDQKLDMNSPSNFSGRILPVRLGEDQ